MLTVILIGCLVGSSYATCDEDIKDTCDNENEKLCKIVFGVPAVQLRFDTLVEQEFFVDLVPFRHCRFVLG